VFLMFFYSRASASCSREPAEVSNVCIYVMVELNNRSTVLGGGVEALSNNTVAEDFNTALT
jgi:hypothetical protein